jgi:hypothetical protein
VSETVRSASSDLSLEEVLDRLRGHDAVDAVCVIGSTATGRANRASDIDLVVVVRHRSLTPRRAPGTPYEVVFTSIGGTPGDIIVVADADLDLLATAEWNEGLGYAKESLIRWIAGGRVVLDRSDRLEAVASRAKHSPPLPWLPSEVRVVWWDANFDLLKIRRYLEAGDPIYDRALPWLMVRAFHEASVGYFKVRQLPWLGEKGSIAYWNEHDAGFLEVFERFLAEAELAARAEVLQELVSRALAPVDGLWPEGETPRSDTWERLVARA